MTVLLQEEVLRRRISGLQNQRQRLKSELFERRKALIDCLTATRQEIERLSHIEGIQALESLRADLPRLEPENQSFPEPLHNELSLLSSFQGEQTLRALKRQKDELENYVTLSLELQVLEERLRRLRHQLRRATSQNVLQKEPLQIFEESPLYRKRRL